MPICPRCKKYTTSTINGVCDDCYDAIIDEEELKSPEELDSIDKISTLSPKLMVRNFVKYICIYQDNPSAEIFGILGNIRNWACHSDHTAACAISEIAKMRKFDWGVERAKWRKNNAGK